VHAVKHVSFKDNHITLNSAYFKEYHSYVQLNVYVNVLIRRETNREKSGVTGLKNKGKHQDGVSLFSPFQTAAGRPTFCSVVKQTLEKTKN